MTTPRFRPLMLALAAGALLTFPSVTAAQDKAADKAAPKAPAEPERKLLQPGDPAPALKVAKWVKGSEVKSFEKGRIYVVEFWATWCGPCKVSIPKLTELAAKYKDKVTFIGTNIWEDKTYDAGTLTKVEKFVKEQGDKMAYTVAYDGKEKAMDKAYMQAAGRTGIPSAFLVDKAGKIAWIGHPAELEAELEKLVGDSDKSKTHEKKKDKDKDKDAGAAGHGG